MLKIYFDTIPLFITKEPTKTIQTYLTDPNTVTIESMDDEEVEKLLAKVQTDKVAGIILNDEQAALKAVQKHFQLIQAAGGLVYTDGQQILLIYRRGKWDLPKGKLDEGEELKQCAVREVEEETGLTNLTIEQPLCLTYHTYKQDGQPILKESHWYLMKTGEGQVLTPQLDEDIEKCEWVGFDQLDRYLENTHPSILDVIKEGLKHIDPAKKAMP